MKIYYRPQNQRARIKDVAVGPATKGKSSATSGPRKKIRWKVENPDADRLVFRVYYREERGVAWLPVGEDKPIGKPELVWDTEGVADDTYLLKVVVSDEKSNAPEKTLTHSYISRPVLVDIRRPQIVSLAVRYPWVSGLARDSYSPIRSVEYTLDGGPWRMIGVVDGILDTPTEAFRTLLPTTIKPGAHVLAVRVRDEAGNTSVRQARFVK